MVTLIKPQIDAAQAFATAAVRFAEGTKTVPEPVHLGLSGG
jgi:hypothetical protein